MYTTIVHGTSLVEAERTPFIYSPQRVVQDWQMIEPLIVRSTEQSQGMILVEQIKAQLLEGKAALFTVEKWSGEIESLVVLEVVHYGTYTAARIIACAGEAIAESMKFIDALESWALTQGAIEIEAWCKPAQERLFCRPTFGFKHKCSIITRDLRRKLQ